MADNQGECEPLDSDHDHRLEFMATRSPAKFRLLYLNNRFSAS